MVAIFVVAKNRRKNRKNVCTTGVCGAHTILIAKNAPYITRKKMTNTMTMQEQILMSGLEITSSCGLPLSGLTALSYLPLWLWVWFWSWFSSWLPLQWCSINQWSPRFNGGWIFQACVIVNGNDGTRRICENDSAAGAGQSVVVLGGQMQIGPGVECTSC